MATRISVKAIVLAALADIACTYAYGIVSGLTVFVLFPAKQALSYLTGVPFLLAAVVAGGASALLGGFIAARIAKTRELLHAVLAVVPCMVLGIVLKVTSKVMAMPTWYTIASYGAVIPAALLGGYLGVLRKETLSGAR